MRTHEATMARPDKRPLLQYLRVQERYEAELLHTLRRTASRIDREIRQLERQPGIGARIRAEQLRGTKAAIHREIAALWRLMGSEVEARRADAAAAAVRSNFLYEQMLFRAVMSQADVDYLLRSAMEQAERSVDHVTSRLMGYSRISLSRRVYRSQALVSGQIDRLINDGLAKGYSARELGASVRQFISPNTPGGVKYAMQRLGRTELNNAFHATQIRGAVQAPWITGMKWNLSGSHKVPDECNEYAETEHTDGGGPGVFLPKDVPAKPHPQCLCYCTPVTVERDEFIDRYMAGEYDRAVDKLMAGGTVRF